MTDQRRPIWLEIQVTQKAAGSAPSWPSAENATERITSKPFDMSREVIQAFRPKSKAMQQKNHTKPAATIFMYFLVNRSVSLPFATLGRGRSTTSGSSVPLREALALSSHQETISSALSRRPFVSSHIADSGTKKAISKNVRPKAPSSRYTARQPKPLAKNMVMRQAVTTPVAPMSM